MFAPNLHQRKPHEHLETTWNEPPVDSTLNIEIATAIDTKRVPSAEVK